MWSISSESTADLSTNIYQEALKTKGFLNLTAELLEVTDETAINNVNASIQAKDSALKEQKTLFQKLVDFVLTYLGVAQVQIGEFVATSEAASSKKQIHLYFIKKTH